MVSEKDKGEQEIQMQLITKDFLESQLNLKIESFTVESGTKAGDNYMSMLYSISVRILSNHENAKTSHVEEETQQYYLLKCYPSHPSRQKFLNKANHFFRELSFYKTLAKDLVQFQSEIIYIREDEIISLAIPLYHAGKAINFTEHEKCLVAVQDKLYSPLENFILMTDMRKAFGFKMTDRRKGLDFDHVKLAFYELGTMHALSWAYRKKVIWDLGSKYPFLHRSSNQRKTDVWMGILKENVDTAVASIDSVKGKENILSKALQNFYEQGRIVLDYFFCPESTLALELQKMLRTNCHHHKNDYFHWQVVCHGDCWSNNMLFQYNEKTGKPQNVVIVDFPLVKLGCPTLDLACLVYTSTRSNFRRKHLKDSIQIYYDRFVDVCAKMKVEWLPDFSLDAIESRFQISKLVGLLIALISLPLNLIGEEKEVDMEKMNEKSTMAEMFQKACVAGVEGSSLYTEWIVELVEDLRNDGVI